MRMYDIIAHKRDHNPLTESEIRFFVEGYTNGSIPDYQASALLMAIFLNGMNREEIKYLTLAMCDSGDTIDLSAFGDDVVDKHSTGGVGDKTTLIVAPVVAALGCKVAKMSGRGLGHTGGTADKLESIRGFRLTLSAEEFMRQVNEIGVAIVTQSGNLAPADKKLYALRDVTATVNSIPLIASSIMSKKLASGCQNIVLDVKVGSGAFMKTEADARCLAETMVAIGKDCGRSVQAVLTDMNVPLGCAIGNALEVRESIAVLRGGGDAVLRRVCVTLAASMVSVCKKISVDKAQQQVYEVLDNGAAYDMFCRWITAQGGDANALPSPDQPYTARYEHIVTAQSDGYIVSMDTEKVGTAAMLLGAGRRTKEEEIDPVAGVLLLKKTGDRVTKGEPIATLYSDTVADFGDADTTMCAAVKYGTNPPKPISEIYGVIE